MKICKDCKKEKELIEFYGKQGECKNCTKAKVRTAPERLGIRRICFTCNKCFPALKTEIKRGGGITCSRECFFKRFTKVVKREHESPNWKGDDVGKEALHNWVQKYRGKPRKCEHCGTTKAEKYEWANKSQEYKRELNDWLRLCTKCHAKYDYPTRQKKWRESVIKLGWKVKPLQTEP